MKGKTVALVSIEGEPTSRATAEVALVNQLIRRGTFVLVPKKTIEELRAAPDLNPTHWQELARRAQADYALRARVLQFDADARDGYSSEEIEDSQLEEETGKTSTSRVYKVRSLTGTVRIELEFTDLAQGETRVGIAEHRDEVVSEGRASAARLPSRMGFLENLANEAFRQFFERYNQ